MPPSRIAHASTDDDYWDSDQDAMLKVFAVAKGLAKCERPDVGEQGTTEPADAAG